MTESLPDPIKASNPDNDFIRRIRLIEGDITQQTDVDAIAMALDASLVVEQGVNRRIVDAAGSAFDEALLEHIYRPRLGDVYVLPGYNLHIPHVMVAVTPEWRDGILEDRDLVRCYRGFMDMAWRMDIKRLAVTVAGVGRHQFALSRAARLVLQGLRERMPEGLEEVRIVCETSDIYKAFADRLK